MIEDIAIIIYIFFTMHFLHEIMHSVAALSTGAWMSNIKLQLKPIPSLSHRHLGGNKDIVLIFGGIGTSLVFSIFSIFTAGLKQFTFLTFAWMQICYGLYEFFGLNAKIKYGRYIIYLIFVMVILWKMIGLL